MQLADETAHLALAYVAASQRQGYLMSTHELEEYLKRPGRRPGSPGTPAQTIATTLLQRSLREHVVRHNETILDAVRRALGVRAEQIPAQPGTSGESTTDWLTRLRWLRVEDDRVRTTALGDAILAHLEQSTLEEEIPVGVLLNQGDELATAKVIAEIAEVGPCALIDPYFSMHSLLPLVNTAPTKLGRSSLCSCRPPAACPETSAAWGTSW